MGGFRLNGNKKHYHYTLYLMYMRLNQTFSRPNINTILSRPRMLYWLDDALHIKSSTNSFLDIFRIITGGTVSTPTSMT